VGLDQLYRLHIPFVAAFLTVVVVLVLAGGRSSR